VYGTTHQNPVFKPLVTECSAGGEDGGVGEEACERRWEKSILQTARRRQRILRANGVSL
jgi:hypothetical protein